MSSTPTSSVNSQATHLLIRTHEISLKGKNRPEFEQRLRVNLEKSVGTRGCVTTVSGRFVVNLSSVHGPDKQTALSLKQVINRLAHVSGVAAVSPCLVLNNIESDDLSQKAIEWAKHDIESSPEIKTFAVRTRRVNKQFPISSTDFDRSVGSQIKSLREGLTVNLKEHDLKVTIEIRYKHALIYSWEKQGVGGLPVDSTQRVMCLLSGGIDSPVAAYEIMRRGCTPVLVHFHSKPFTSEASISKVKRLAAVLRQYSPNPLELWLVPLLEIQKAVRDSCNERHRTIHYRRFMMMIAQELANKRGAKALVTGEAIGQVASQTLTNMQAIEDIVQLPVLRPLITTDKPQIVERAQQIGSYEVSIEPHDDTCVLFAPQNPATQAKLSNLREESDTLPMYQLVFSALDRAEKILV